MTLLIAFLALLAAAVIASILGYLDEFLLVLGVAAFILFGLAPITGPLLASIGAPAWLTTTVMAVGNAGWVASLGVGFGLTMLISEDAANEVAEVAGEAGEVVGEVTGEAAGGLLSTVPSSLWLTGAAAIGVYWWLTSDSDGTADQRRVSNGSQA